MKRFLSICLVLCLILSALPLTASLAAKNKVPTPGSSTAKIKASSTFKPTCVGQSATKVKVSWKKFSGAYRYYVYVRYSKTGDYYYLGSTTSLSYVDSKAKKGKVNYYTILAETDEYYYQSYETGCYPMTPPSLTVTKKSDKKTVLKWKKVAGADKYEIQYTAKKGGTYKKVATVSKAVLSYSYNKAVSDTGTFRIRATRKDGSVSAFTPVTVKVEKKKTVTHALHTLFVFEEDFPSGSGCTPMRTSNGDMNLWKSMLSKGTPLGYPWKSWDGSKQHVYKNLSASQLLSRIKKLASCTGEGDVTLFYLSTHGNSYQMTGEYAGQLAFTDGSRMTISTLANQLKKIPGRVVVILCSCGGGASIYKGADGKSGSSFESEVISAFRNADVKVKVEDESENGDSHTKANGELLSSKFCVICAAQAGTNGLYYQDGYQVIAKWLSQGVWAADANNNNIITIGEMSSYLKRKGQNTPFELADHSIVYMKPATYCAAQSFALFK